MLFSDLAHSSPQDRIEIIGEEAHHARVKRVRPGERVALLDGEGNTATGTLDVLTGSKSSPRLEVSIEELTRHDPISPVLELSVALPKGDRLDRMIDQITQLGVSSIRPLICERSQRKPGTVRPDKLARIADEAMKQCRRPWRLEIGDSISLDDALRDPDAMVADASGDVWVPASDSAPRTNLLVGPEGGWSNTERGLFVESRVTVRRFGLFVLRIETAAVAAAAMVLGG